MQNQKLISIVKQNEKLLGASVSMRRSLKSISFPINIFNKKQTFRRSLPENTVNPLNLICFNSKEFPNEIGKLKESKENIEVS